MNDAEQAALGQAAGAAKLAEDTAKAKGETITAAEKNEAMRQSLLDIVQTLGPNDPLRQHLMDYITQLGEVQPPVHTDVTADTSQAEKAISNLMGSIRSFVLPHNTVLGATTQTSGYNAPAGVGVSAQAAAGAPAPSSDDGRRWGARRAGRERHLQRTPGVNPADLVRALNRWTSTRGTPVTSGATGL